MKRERFPFLRTGASALCTVVFAAVVFASCSSYQGVTRVDSSTQTDLTGYWNDTDVRIVCESLIADCLSSPRLRAFTEENGRLPVFIVGYFANESSEHIDMGILAKRMEAAILNSGRAEFVASAYERDELRHERGEQQGWASEETAKSIANETGADFMLTGSIRTIVERAGSTTVRTYYVYAELTDIESNRRIWIGENNEIKKIIESPSYRF